MKNINLISELSKKIPPPRILFYIEIFWVIGLYTSILSAQLADLLFVGFLGFFILYAIFTRSFVASLIVGIFSVASLFFSSVWISSHLSEYETKRDVLKQEKLEVIVIRQTKQFGSRALSPVEVTGSGEKIGLIHDATILPIGTTLLVEGEEKKIDDAEPIGNYIKSLDLLGLYQGNIVATEFKEQTISSLVLLFVQYLREYIEHIIQAHLPGDSGAFTSGILFGIDERLTDERQEVFRRIGVTHILAISGSNVVLVIVLFQMFIQKIPFLGRKIRYGITLTAIVFFIILTGAEGSIIRAGIFAIIILTAVELGRLRQATRGLLHSTILISITYPFTILYDVGFQLSILASLGLIWGGKYARYIPTFFGKIAWETFCAQIFVLPLLIWTFGGFSLISFIANLIIIPIIPLTMLVGVFCLVPYVSPIFFITDSINRSVFWISDQLFLVPAAYWEVGEYKAEASFASLGVAVFLPLVFWLLPKVYFAYKMNTV